MSDPVKLKVECSNCGASICEKNMKAHQKTAKCMNKGQKPAKVEKVENLGERTVKIHKTAKTNDGGPDLQVEEELTFEDQVEQDLDDILEKQDEHSDKLDILIQLLQNLSGVTEKD